MKLDPEGKPVIKPAHKIPVAMQYKVKAELQRIVSILTPVSEPTEWISAMVAAHKNNSDDIRPQRSQQSP